LDVEGASARQRTVRLPSAVDIGQFPIPHPEQLQEAFQRLGTVTAVARVYGVSRWTVYRWTKKLNLEPELRPEIPIHHLLSGLLSEKVVRTRVAQWIVDEASISIAYNSRTGTTSLMLAGAMNDDSAMDAIAQALDVRVGSGATPPKGRLPMHTIRIQGPKAYGLLGLVLKELTGLKAMEAKVALSFFPPSGIVKGKLTTDVYMGTVWRQFARESVEEWNRRRRKKLSLVQIEEIVEAWILNRTARARRGLIQHYPTEVQAVSSLGTP
jgi:translation initiation factor 1 (eIF-1/SUI1)